MPTNETDLLRNEINRLNQLIDVLLTANQQLQQQVKELSGVPSSSLPIASTYITAGNPSGEVSGNNLIAGNNETTISSNQLPSGKLHTDFSGNYMLSGNPATDISTSKLPPGKIEMKNGKFSITVGTYNFEIEGVNLKPAKNGAPVSLFHLALRHMMKNGTQSHIYTTAIILQQLHSQPATSLPQLQHLTGLSYDGIAKRIMMMKKQGFIVAHIAPKRFVLAEKAAQLFVGL